MGNKLTRCPDNGHHDVLAEAGTPAGRGLDLETKSQSHFCGGTERRLRKSPYVPQKLGQSLANGYPVRRDRNEKLDAPVMLVKWYDWTTSNNPTNEINNIGFRVASS